LAEIAMMWNQLQTNAIPTRPLVLVGNGWQNTITALLNGQDGYIPQEHRSYLTFADTVETAYRHIT
jgi:predicted Rossmann-fold nucleotide-binding protein